MFKWLNSFIGSDRKEPHTSHVSASRSSVAAGRDINNSNIKFGLDEDKIGQTLEKRKLQSQIDNLNSNIISLKHKLAEDIRTDGPLFDGMDQAGIDDLKQTMLNIRNSADFWDWSRLHLRLGIAISQLADMEMPDPQYRKKALEAFRQSVKYGVSYTSADEWGLAQVNIGYTIMFLDSNEKLIDDGIASVERGLRSIEGTPLIEQRAFAQSVLGQLNVKKFVYIKKDNRLLIEANRHYNLAREDYRQIGDEKRVELMSFYIRQFGARPE